jgi:hypothetical protein
MSVCSLNDRWDPLATIAVRFQLWYPVLCPPRRNPAQKQGKKKKSSSPQQPNLRNPFPRAGFAGRVLDPPREMMIPWGGVGCCLSAAALYLLGRSSGRCGFSFLVLSLLSIWRFWWC